MPDYLRCNYRLVGSRIDDSAMGSLFYAGCETMSFSAGQYMTDLSAYVSYTASVLFFRARYAWNYQATASYPIQVYGHFSYTGSTTAYSTLAWYEARRLQLVSSSGTGSDSMMLVVPTTSVSILSVYWDCLVTSHILGLALTG
jgi:hypothetical protein